MWRRNWSHKKWKGESTTTFHEISRLAATLLKDAGNTNTAISNVMAHESINTTLDYMNPVSYTHLTLPTICSV